jgi:hypothetical protein
MHHDPDVLEAIEGILLVFYERVAEATAETLTELSRLGVEDWPVDVPLPAPASPNRSTRYSASGFGGTGLRFWA